MTAALVIALALCAARGLADFPTYRVPRIEADGPSALAAAPAAQPMPTVAGGAEPELEAPAAAEVVRLADAAAPSPPQPPPLDAARGALREGWGHFLRSAPLALQSGGVRTMEEAAANEGFARLVRRSLVASALSRSNAVSLLTDLSFLSPAAGAAWPPGSEQTVQWSTHLDAPLSLELLTANGTLERALKENVDPTQQQLALTVPDDVAPSNTEAYRLRFRGAGGEWRSALFCITSSGECRLPSDADGAKNGGSGLSLITVLVPVGVLLCASALLVVLVCTGRVANPLNVCFEDPERAETPTSAGSGGAHKSAELAAAFEPNFGAAGGGEDDDVLSAGDGSQLRSRVDLERADMGYT